MLSGIFKWVFLTVGGMRYPESSQSSQNNSPPGSPVSGVQRSRSNSFNGVRDITVNPDVSMQEAPVYVQLHGGRLIPSKNSPVLDPSVHKVNEEVAPRRFSNVDENGYPVKPSIFKKICTTHQASEFVVLSEDWTTFINYLDFWRDGSMYVYLNHNNKTIPPEDLKRKSSDVIDKDLVNQWQNFLYFINKKSGVLIKSATFMPNGYPVWYKITSFEEIEAIVNVLFKYNQFTEKGTELITEWLKQRKITPISKRN